MIDQLFLTVLSNSFFAFCMLLAAIIVNAKFGKIRIAGAICAGGLLKLFWPIGWAIPLFVQSESDLRPLALNADPFLLPTEVSTGSILPSTISWQESLLLLWIVGSVVVFLCSSFRILKFDRLLASSLKLPSRYVNPFFNDLGIQMRLRRVPEVHISKSKITPMLWSAFGKAKVYVPENLITELDEEDLRWIVAHEFAHYKNGDHLTRWVEWFATIVFWWNPVMWLIRRSLRQLEELCCDARVLDHYSNAQQDYAASLLKAIEFLSRSHMPIPSFANQINKKSFTEMRFKNILDYTGQTDSMRRALFVSFLIGLMILPVGFSCDQFEEKDSEALALDSSMERHQINSKEKFYVVTDEIPQLIGGYSAIQESLVYPETAKKAEVKGTVYVQFIVDVDGKPQDVVVMKGVGAGCDEEALRVVRTLRFEPGIVDGKAVATAFSLPINFGLSEDDTSLMSQADAKVLQEVEILRSHRLAKQVAKRLFDRFEKTKINSGTKKGISEMIEDLEPHQKNVLARLSTEDGLDRLIRNANQLAEDDVFGITRDSTPKEIEAFLFKLIVREAHETKPSQPKL